MSPFCNLMDLPILSKKNLLLRHSAYFKQPEILPEISVALKYLDLWQGMQGRKKKGRFFSLSFFYLKVLSPPPPIGLRLYNHGAPLTFPVSFSVSFPRVPCVSVPCDLFLSYEQLLIFHVSYPSSSLLCPLNAIVDFEDLLLKYHILHDTCS